MQKDQVTVLIRDLSKDPDKERLNQIYDFLYSDIKSIARKQINLLNTGQTITPTVLAHECYLKLYQAQDLSLESRRHFLACLARSMRMFLIDTLRAKQSQKRQHEVEVITEFVGDSDLPLHLLDFDRVLDQIEQVDERLAHIVQYRLLFKLSVAEQAELLGLSERQVTRLWKQGKAMLLAMLKETH